MADFKENLIKRIRETDDQNLLEEIYRLLDIEADDFGKLSLSDEEKKAIEQGRKDIENGDSISGYPTVPNMD